jgi:L-threonylcarbamoyladenylate synthase
MNTLVLPASDPEALSRAEILLRSGALVAFPTDTVYGLGALVTDEQGIEKLYAVKGRDNLKAIPVLVGNAGQLAQVVAGLNAPVQRLTGRFWPGPLTLVVPSRPGLPDRLSPTPTIGVRLPDHPIAQALMERTGPLAVTSANLSGGKDTVTAAQVLDQLGGRIPLILDGGRTPGGAPSSVVDCTGPQPVLLRAGPISIQAILQAWNG